MEQLNFAHETKTDLAIRFIQEHEPPEGYFLGFSGGKDSVVLYDLSERSGVKFQAWYSCTGIDAPELVKFIKNEYPSVKFAYPKESFFKQLVKRGYPTKFTRWCCDFLKKDPTKNVGLNHRLMGIRAEESSARAKRNIIDKMKRGHQIIYKPLFHWLEWEIWEYIESHELSYCKLYDEGFDRLGCVVCPFLTPKKMKFHKERWPQIYNAFEKSMRKLYISSDIQKKGFDETCDEFIYNWYHGMTKREVSYALQGSGKKSSP